MLAHSSLCLLAVERQQRAARVDLSDGGSDELHESAGGERLLDGVVEDEAAVGRRGRWPVAAARRRGVFRAELELRTGQHSAIRVVCVSRVGGAGRAGGEGQHTRVRHYVGERVGTQHKP